MLQGSSSSNRNMLFPFWRREMLTLILQIRWDWIDPLWNIRINTSPQSLSLRTSSIAIWFCFEIDVTLSFLWRENSSYRISLAAGGASDDSDWLTESSQYLKLSDSLSSSRFSYHSFVLPLIKNFSFEFSLWTLLLVGDVFSSSNLLSKWLV